MDQSSEKHQQTKLCDITDLNRTGAKGLAIEINGVLTDVFVVKDASGIYAYIDHCPHRGSPLSWKEDEFLDEEGEYIICATHAALFSIHNGDCLSGPCVDQSLTALPIKIVNQQIFLHR